MNLIVISFLIAISCALNQRPIVGVFTQPANLYLRPYGKQYVAASYVKVGCDLFNLTFSFTNLLELEWCQSSTIPRLLISKFFFSPLTGLSSPVAVCDWRTMHSFTMLVRICISSPSRYTPDCEFCLIYRPTLMEPTSPSLAIAWALKCCTSSLQMPIGPFCRKSMLRISLCMYCVLMIE